MKGKASQKSYEFPHGPVEAVLEEVRCYVADNYNTKEPEVNLTLVWNMGEHPDKPNDDLLFYDAFVTVYQDDDGYPVIGGKRAKLYKRLYGLYGREFDPTDEGIDFEIAFPKKYDDPELLLDMPGFDKDNPLLVRSIKLYGKELIGQTAMIDLGFADIPGTNKKSERTSIINCTPVARRPQRRNRPEPEEDAPAPKPTRRSARAEPEEDLEPEEIPV